jgi:hypothetical protein
MPREWDEVLQLLVRKASHLPRKLLESGKRALHPAMTE